MQLSIERVDWEFAVPFRIAYRTRTHAQTIVVTLSDGETVGRGEAQGVSYRGESVETIAREIDAVATKVGKGISRTELQTLLGPGGARNALDCALWDLECKRSGVRAWSLAGLEQPSPIATTLTIGVATPAAMRAAALAAADCSMLKVKLAGDGCDIERVREIRAVRPDAGIIVDANQSWSADSLEAMTAELAALEVSLIEQPLAAGADEALLGFQSPIPLCADESCQTINSLPGVLGKYAYANIKLDKTGGLAGALELARAAREAGLGLMVGCMGGSSLAMAPAFMIAQLCDFVDLDGPLLLIGDVPDAIHYDGNRMEVPSARLWG